MELDYTGEVELLKEVAPGRKRDVAELYAIAAMWLRAGEPLHPSHATWLADRLDDLANVIGGITDNTLGKELARAAWATGTRGRKSADISLIGKQRVAVMLYSQLQGEVKGHDKLLAKVAEGSLLTPDQVKDAWKNRAKLLK